jgi:hypothetical protein
VRLEKVTDDELHNLYFSPNIRVMKSHKMSGACRMHERCIKVIVGEVEGNIILER